MRSAAGWTAALTRELLELVWLVEATLALEPALDAVLDEIVSGGCAARAAARRALFSNVLDEPRAAAAARRCSPALVAAELLEYASIVSAPRCLRRWSAGPGRGPG